jgi:hypothetical protein
MNDFREIYTKAGGRLPLIAFASRMDANSDAPLPAWTCSCFADPEVIDREYLRPAAWLILPSMRIEEMTMNALQDTESGRNNNNNPSAP